MNRLTHSVCLVLFASACGGGTSDDDMPNRQEFSELGRKIFFDTSLSNPKGMSCATCHSPNAAFSDPTHALVSNGAVPGKRGQRNSPSIMYSLFSPVFGFSDDEGDYVGGQFLDGAARDLEEQAKRPFFRHNEMNLSGASELRDRIRSAPYVEQFKSLYGEQSLDDEEQTLLSVVNAISAFENSEELRPFSSKYDAWAVGKATLTEQESRGLQLFNAPNKGNCAACHPSTSDDGSAVRALFTDFTYDNIGLPKNSAANPDTDVGLMATTGRPADVGRFKVPTLRNVELTPPYFHNGAFSTLKETVHFYNARDTDSSIEPAEFDATKNAAELGNLGLTNQEEDDIVAFLRTLTDGYKN